MLVPRLDLGRATIEIELVDSQTGERVAIAVATAKGKRYFAGISGMKRWGDVKKAFEKWAKQFRVSLDNARR